jgi:hypothetical protein
LAFAKNLRFLCGQRDFHGNHLKLAVSIYFELLYSLVRKDEQSKYGDEFVIAYNEHKPLNLNRTLPGIHFETVTRPLLDLLYVSYVTDPEEYPQLLASDPRDLVYGLLSRATDARELGIRPDYRKSCRNIYIGTAMKLVDLYHLKVLAFSNHPRNMDDLPSWVPDWSSLITNGISDRYQDPGTKYTGAMRYPHPTSQDYRSFRASGENTPSCKIKYKRTLSPVLEVSGFIVDTVKKKANVWKRKPLRETAYQMIEYIQAITSMFDGGDGDEIAKIWSDDGGAKIWKTSITDREKLTNGGYCRVRPRYYEGMHQNFMKVVKRSKYRTKDQLTDMLYRCFRPDSDSGVYDFLLSLNTLAIKRRPFLTEKDYIGQGPELIDIGDTVAILNGYPVPVILRKRKERGYKFLGEAYVHGIMDGEFLQTDAVEVKLDIY